MLNTVAVLPVWADGLGVQHVRGVPCYLWMAHNAAQIMGEDAVYVLTDSAAIARDAEHFGFKAIEVSEDAEDQAPEAFLVMADLVRGTDIDVVLRLEPVLPFLCPETLQAILTPLNAGANAVVGGYESLRAGVVELDNAQPVTGIPFIDCAEVSAIRVAALLDPQASGDMEAVRVDLPALDRVLLHDDTLHLVETIANGLHDDAPPRKGIVEYLPLQDIQMIVLDVDGVMTDGAMIFTESGDELKRFNVKDGMAIRRAVDSGVRVAICSAGHADKAIRKRADMLGIDPVHVGHGRKLDVVQGWSDAFDIPLQKMAYIGDDVNDIPVMARVGFSGCPADAVDAVRRQATVVLPQKGGQGCVRSFIEILRGE
jgi:YrbI family 3-deoxy-D-manno-octulosonate 8-phosphate phosphatase